MTKANEEIKQVVNEIKKTNAENVNENGIYKN